MEESANGAEGSSADEGRGGPTPEYERQRLSRIRENRARLEALGLPSLASSLLGRPPSKREERRERAKRRGDRGRGADDEDEDEDYRPSDGDQDEEGEGGGGSSSFGDEAAEEEEEQEGKKSSSSSRRKGKKRSSSNEAKVMEKGKTREPDDLIGDDTALNQAIALSLGERVEDSSEAVSRVPQNSGTSVADSGPRRKKDQTNVYETSGKRKNKIVNKSRAQLTEDEVVAYFFSFDEIGKGYITVRDLEKMVIAHDFSWTQGEIYNMIHCFDSDGGGKLSLEDFRSIICRCNMMQDARQC